MYQKFSVLIWAIQRKAPDDTKRWMMSAALTDRMIGRMLKEMREQLADIESIRGEIADSMVYDLLITSGMAGLFDNIKAFTGEKWVPESKA